MRQYIRLLNEVLKSGDHRLDRTGTGALSVFGRQMRFNLQEGFPLLTTKRVSFHNVKAELLWFLSGNHSVEWLHEHGVTIWDEWARPDGTFGPIYGKQWRDWESHFVTGFDEQMDNAEMVFADREHDIRVYKRQTDQLREVINTIKTNPHSRRMLVSAWNVGELPDMALPPCHSFFQFFVSNGRLSCQLYQRSADLFLGVPYNIASYSLLTHMVAQVCGLGVGEFVWSGGDVHLYVNHKDQAMEQMLREPRPLPELWLNPVIKDIDGFFMSDIDIQSYNSHPAIKAPISV